MNDLVDADILSETTGKKKDQLFLYKEIIDVLNSYRMIIAKNLFYAIIGFHNCVNAIMDTITPSNEFDHSSFSGIQRCSLSTLAFQDSINPECHVTHPGFEFGITGTTV